MPRPSLYQRHARFLPGCEAAIDLGQGGTPLVKSRRIGAEAGIPDLRFKLEQLNPTGSYKDRFAGLAVGLARAEGHAACVATSSGNTGAALAAFCARAGMGCALYVSENAPQGKLEQMLAYGADVYRVARFTIDAAESGRISETLEREAAARGMQLFITAYAVSPGPMEGIKTLAYEIAEDAPEVADIFLPVGGGGLFVATGRGFDDLVSAGERARPPRLHAVQPVGNDTVATPLREGAAKARPVDTATTISGLGVGYILDGDEVVARARASGGRGYVIDEDRVRAVQRRLAQEEGLLVEPAGAVAVAGALDAAARGELAGDGPVVCVLTGHGFKDPATLQAMGAEPGARLIDRAAIPATFPGAGGAR
ncbi:threonine synthase [Oceanicola granulosus HTCC2516]|uniref:Threonine synthase n=1 Tax=Oceanicola granulosus (strain ATCC BAA-861 / DSM 15982 / KCTC 12143 / HTCC2516) TaxID=314256 RepID=Q2CJ64_OCEGH|nr:pyridoxal-phosphate dependent enzyme [Oceanicola granulosus]EAR52736.1 threonine synthase [Oceanicola granulosus HTCC2516]